MKYKVLIMPRAQSDYVSLHTYLKGKFGRKAAARLRGGFRKAVKTLASTPHMYEAVPGFPDVRKCAALSPSLILYQVDEVAKTVQILTIYDGRYENV